MPRLISLVTRVLTAALGAALLLSAPLAAAPPNPGQGKHDWIQLPAGEWLAGTIKLMRDESLEFDSEKLNDQTFDWVDIIQLRSPNPLTYSFTGQRTAVGTAIMQDSTIRIVSGSDTLVFPRSELLAIVQGTRSEWSFWSGSLGAGFDATNGNTDQVETNIRAEIKRDGADTHFELRYIGNFNQLGGVENANNHNVNVNTEYFLSRRTFLTPLALQFYSDRFQNIALRTTAAVGAGYYLVRDRKLKWLVSGSSGYLATEHRSVPAGDDLVVRSGAVIPATAVEWDITKDIDLELDYTAVIGIPDVEDWYHHADLQLDLDNLSIVDVTFAFTWDHVAKPSPREDGSTPLRDDFRTTFGIQIEF